MSVSENWLVNRHKMCIILFCQAGYYQLRQQRPLVQSMTEKAARTVAEACRLDCCKSLFYSLLDTLLRYANCGLCRTSLHNWSLTLDVVIISCRYYANSIGYPSESVTSSKSHVWFASRCPCRHLSTWQTIAVACPTALGTLCSQTYVVSRTLSSYGDRTFAAVGPRL